MSFDNVLYARMPNVYVAAVDGVPLMTPADEPVIPEGKVPLMRAYEPAFIADNCIDDAPPLAMPASELAVDHVGRTATVMEYSFVTWPFWAPLFAGTLKLNTPSADVVPLKPP
jgi:hypothetical protein